MTTVEAAYSEDWKVGVRVWVERAGQAVLGKGRLELLEGIDHWHSISAAARHLGMSYRRAWLLVQSINQAAEAPLVVSVTGGSHGGGAELTPRGRWAVEVFARLQGQVHQSAVGLLAQLTRRPMAEVVHVAAAVSLQEVLGQLLADFAAEAPAVQVRTLYAASDELADLVRTGTPADVFISAAPALLDGLEAAGRLVPGSKRLVAQNSLVAVGASDRQRRIRKPSDLTGTGVQNLALARSSCPLGGYTRSYLETLGLYETLRPRVIWVDNSRSVLAALHAARADVGFIYGSELTQTTPCHVLFRAARLTPPIRYEAALIRDGSQPELARRLLAFLTAQPAGRRFRQCGFTLPD